MTATKPTSFTHLNDAQLLEQTQRLVETEREVTLSILHTFAEIESRRLFAKRGYPSLFAMAVELFKYSPGAAERRISASRLLRQMPEVESKISEGSLNLTVVAKAHTFFEAEKRVYDKSYTVDQKREVVARLENLSTRDAERELLRISPEHLPRESSRPLSDTYTEIRLVVSQELLASLNQLRDQFSHANPGMTYGGVIEILVKKAQGRSQSQKQEKASVDTPASTPVETPVPAPVRTHAPAPVASVPSNAGRITLSRRRQVVDRDRGVCTFIDPITGRQCQSQAFLEVDHILPRAMGGGDELENLRLLCRSHNQLSAIGCFGEKKMRQYIDPT